MNQSLWTSWHILPIPVYLQRPNPQHHIVYSLAADTLRADFFHCCLQQKGHSVHITMSMFQVLNTAETERYKYFNFNQRAPGFKQTFNISRVTAETTACTSPAAVQRRAASLKRCLVDVWHLSLGLLINKKPGTG